MGACTRLVDIGDADAHRHRRRLCGVEGDPAAGALARRRMAARAVGGAAATLGRAFGDLIAAPGARTSVVEGKSVYVSVELGGSRIINTITPSAIYKRTKTITIEQTYNN